MCVCVVGYVCSGTYVRTLAYNELCATIEDRRVVCMYSPASTFTACAARVDGRKKPNVCLVPHAMHCTLHTQQSAINLASSAHCTLHSRAPYADMNGYINIDTFNSYCHSFHFVAVAVVERELKTADAPTAETIPHEY